MKLYDLVRGSRFKLVAYYKTQVPPYAAVPIEQTYTFGRVDGMYSNSKGDDGITYYFAAWTEVIKEESNERK